MLFIVNKDIPPQARNKLQSFGEVFEFSTENLTYPVVSNHPDIFFCQAGGTLYCAPNTPKEFVQRLVSKGLNIKIGDQPVGMQYPKSALYNAVITDNYFIHNHEITDTALILAAPEKIKINVKQGYCRCSLLPLKNDYFITSDNGICKRLLTEGLNVLYVNPDGIILPGEKYGLFGGTSGVSDNRVFITGNLNLFPDGKKVREYLTSLDYNVIELYDGPLFDGGSIIVLELV
jgi:hypothetical protein